MVEQIPAAVADPALGNALLPWISKAGSFGMDAKSLHRVDHIAIELCAAIKDQIAGGRVIRKGLAQLLNNPGAGGVFGHIAVEDRPPLIRNDEEATEHARKKGPFRVEHVLVNGQVLEMAFNLIVVHGKTTGVSVFGKDVTERKAAKESLRESGDFLRTCPKTDVGMAVLKGHDFSRAD
jgi:hypothetical protein